MKWILASLVAAAVLGIGLLYWMGAGGPGVRWEEGAPTERALDVAGLDRRARAQASTAAALGVRSPRARTDDARPPRSRKQILFGDLHVHTTFSLDAFVLALPLTGGDGVRPVSDACDFARYCSALDFWSVNDHAEGITPWKWEQTVEAIRQCDAIAGETRDVTPFLGWEWTQVGRVPERHYGHKNVVLRGLDDDVIPDRPVAAIADRPLMDSGGSRVLSGLLGAMRPTQDVFDLLRFGDDIARFADCPPGVPVREQAEGCRDGVRTPAELFARLDDWGFDSVVIPHGTTWGLYTPPGSNWDKQLEGAMHDPERQTLFEVFSGHGNSEEYRAWREIDFDASGDPFCPKPSGNYLSGCWRAGEIIAERCAAAGESDEECEERAATARQHYVEAGLAGNPTVPGATGEDWQDAAQCRDCFQPAFNYRPRSSAQYVMALRDFSDPENPRRFEFGFMASSDNHSARPGTGYKEYGRTENTDTRSMRLHEALFGAEAREEPAPYSVASQRSGDGEIDPAEVDAERGASFFGTGGLIAVHADGRSRDEIWQAIERKEVYGTSGPRMLLWFDLLNPSGTSGREVAMGGQTELRDAPIFRVRAAGSFEQQPGCPEESAQALGPDRLQRLCGNECHHPSDVRRRITRIEVVRIQPQNAPGEDVTPLIRDPWKVLRCESSPDGCVAMFTDSDFQREGRDTLYYVRAIEAPSPAVAGDALGCTRDETGRCIATDACADRPDSDDCLGSVEERAWSSPIFVGYSD